MQLFRLQHSLALFLLSFPVLHGQCLPKPTASYGPYSPTKRSSTLANPLGTNIMHPLKIVAVGDSVMWGNGDSPDKKFVTKIAKFLADGTQRQVTVVSYAHSGARLSKVEANDSTTPVIDGEPEGDLNAARPTIQEQVSCVAKENLDAEVLLVDGCINDVGALRIALPFPFNLVSKTDIREDTYNACSTPMRDLLETVKTSFPQATIIVLNYYRIVSKDSRLLMIKATSGQPVTLSAPDSTPDKEVDKLTQEQEKLEALQNSRLLLQSDTIVAGETAAQSHTRAIQLWRTNSDVFLTTSKACLQWAVASADGEFVPISKEDAAKHECPNVVLRTSSRIQLATVPDIPDFAYGTRKTHLWKIPVHFWFISKSLDQMYWKRSRICDRAYPDSAGLREGCRIDPTAHPNVAGAEAYATSINNLLAVSWAKVP